MPRYKTVVWEENSGTVEIEANSEDEARELIDMGEYEFKKVAHREVNILEDIILIKEE